MQEFQIKNHKYKSAVCLLTWIVISTSACSKHREPSDSNDDSQAGGGKNLALSFSEPSQSKLSFDCAERPSIKLSGSCSRSGGSITLSGLVNAKTTCSQDRKWRVDVVAAMLKSGNQSITVQHADAKERVVKQTRRFEINTTAAGKPISGIQDLINVQNNRAACYYLTQDIDLSAVNWTYAEALGNFDFPFTGMINGRNHRIKNLKSPNSFISFIQGATVKNIIFEAPRFGEGSLEGGDGPFNVAMAPIEAGRESKLINVHVKKGQVFGGSIKTPGSLGLLAAGGLVAVGHGVSIWDSTTEVTFVSSHPRMLDIRGMIGRVIEALATSPNSVRIENSKANVVVKYHPVAIAGDTRSPELSYAGGLIGSAFYQNARHQLIVKKSQAEIQISTSPDFNNFRSSGWGGLVGAYFAPASKATDSTLFSVQESQARVDFNLHLPDQWNGHSIQWLSGLSSFFLEGASVKNRVKLIQDSYATGRIQVTGPARLNKYRGLAGIAAMFNGHADEIGVQIDRTYAQVSLISPSLESTRPAVFLDKGKISGAANLYNSDTVAFVAAAGDHLASGLSTAQMQSSSAWLKAGYSPNVWNIQNGNLPTLRASRGEKLKAPEHAQASAQRNSIRARD